jgi:hypothetical protein
MSRDQVGEIVEGFNRDLPVEGSRYQITSTGTAIESLGSSWEIDADGVFVLLQLIEQIQDQVIESATGKAWPRCDHGTHPRVPTEAGWSCPVDDRPPWPYGTVQGRDLPAEPELEDNVVRWFLQERVRSGVPPGRVCRFPTRPDTRRSPGLPSGGLPDGAEYRPAAGGLGRELVLRTRLIGTADRRSREHALRQLRRE